MQPLKIVAVNINDDRRGYMKHNAFCSEFSLKQRMPKIVEQINKKLKEGYIVAICEIQNDNAKILVDLVKTKNYVIGKYNNSYSSMVHVVFYPEQYIVKNIWNKALTNDSIVKEYQLKSGDFIPDELRPTNDVDRRNDVEYQKFTGGELFEKGILVVEFNGFFLTVVHFGLGSEQRTLQAENTIKILSKIIPEDTPSIICGDFNAFDPKQNGPFMKQHVPFLENGYLNNLDFDVNTFNNPYPYDVGFLLKDSQKFFELLKILNIGKYTEEQLNEYIDICKNGEKKEIPTVALDNIFTKNCKSTPVELTNEFGSDHSELKAIITF